MERCPSGLRSTLGKRVLGKLNRGFESHPLRQTTVFLNGPLAQTKVTSSGPPPGDPASICNGVSGNLVTNCGFEDGNLTGWTLTNPEDSYDEVVSTSGYSSTPVNSGTYAMQIGNFVPPTDTAAILSQTIADTSGATYTFSST